MLMGMRRLWGGWVNILLNGEPGRCFFMGKTTVNRLGFHQVLANTLWRKIYRILYFVSFLDLILFLG